MKDKNKLVVSSVFEILIIFAAPIVLFLLAKEFLFSIDIKNNKIVNILGIVFSYVISWTLFFVKFFYKKDNKNKIENKNESR